MEPCANCGHEFTSAFCPACGQKRTHPGIKLGEVVGDFAAGIFNVDAPILKTFREYVLGPGKVTRAFLAGKRRSYTPPVRYFLFGVAYYFIMRWLLNWDPVDSAVEATTGHAAVETPAMRVNHWMSRNVNLLLPLWLMLIAFFDRILFPRTGLSWVERLVHYLFAAGTYLLAVTTLIPLVKLWPWFQSVNFLLILGMVIWSVISLHKRSVWNMSKAVIMVPLTFMLYVMLSTALVTVMLGIPLDQVFVRPGH